MAGGGFSNQPRLLKGAFVDSNLLAFPPLIVAFQFNPDQLTRRRNTQIQSPRSRRGREEDLPEEEALGQAQTTLTEAETITMDIRLDATDAHGGGRSDRRRVRGAAGALGARDDDHAALGVVLRRLARARRPISGSATARARRS